MAIFLLCAALSIDSLTVGASFGMGRVLVPWTSKLVLACITGLLTLLAQLCGEQLSGIIPPFAAQLAGVFMLTTIGIFTIYRSFRSEKKRVKKTKEYQFRIRALGLSIQVISNPEDCDFDNSKSISVFEALFLGMALSIDSAVGGLGAAVAGFSSPLIPPLVAAMGMLLLCVGETVGRRFSGRDSIIMKVLPGSLLILTGLLRLVPSM